MQMYGNPKNNRRMIKDENKLPVFYQAMIQRFKKSNSNSGSVSSESTVEPRWAQSPESVSTSRRPRGFVVVAVCPGWFQISAVASSASRWCDVKRAHSSNQEGQSLFSHLTVLFLNYTTILCRAQRNQTQTETRSLLQRFNVHSAWEERGCACTSVHGQENIGLTIIHGSKWTPFHRLKEAVRGKECRTILSSSHSLLQLHFYDDTEGQGCVSDASPSDHW